MSSPNILLVFSDQHRAVDVGCYGNEQVSSPNLDRFADESVRLERCIATSPVCVPMRGSLLTGLHAWKHLAITNDLPIDPSCRSLATVLNDAGYRTGYIGKWHLGGIPRDKVVPETERLGFEHWRAAECTHDYDHSWYDDNEGRRHRFTGFETEGQTDLAIDFVRTACEARRTGDGKPWALALSWGPPHAPYDVVPERFRRMFQPDMIRLRANVPERILEHRGTDSWVGRDEVRTMLAGYYAQIAYIDEQFGRLLRLLHELEADAETIVVYTSDHGDMLGSQGVQKKQLPYDESVRVPFMIRWPGHLTPGVRATPMGLVDLPVTLAHLAGANGFIAAGVPDPDGEDRSAWLAGNEPEDPDRAALTYNTVPCHQAEDRGETSGWYGLVTRRYSYATWDDGTTFCLYDNETDPGQLYNLANDASASAIRRELHARTIAEVERAGGVIAPWQERIRDLGLQEEWNRSQVAFGREVLR